jgi:hypothetical protein
MVLLLSLTVVATKRTVQSRCLVLKAQPSLSWNLGLSRLTSKVAVATPHCWTDTACRSRERLITNDSGATRSTVDANFGSLMKIAYQATPQCELMGGNYSGRKRAARKIRLGDVPRVQFLMSMPLVAESAPERFLPRN